MKLSKQIALGLMLASLTACGTPSALPPQVVKPKPDPAWTERVPKPQRSGNDNGALAQLAKALSEALDTANAQLDAIRAWAEER